jgi:hypothetical protein
MRESETEKKVGAYVRKRGGTPYKFTSPERCGVPDRINVLPLGVIVFIEFKATGKKPTIVQYREMDRLKALGQYVYWSDNIEFAKFLIDIHMR